MSLQEAQLVLNAAGKKICRMPVEDLGVIVVGHHGVTYTHAALCALLEKNVAMVLCGPNHHPTGLLLPMEGHTVQAETIAVQAVATERLKDRIWKDIIKAKISNQAGALVSAGKTAGAGLFALCSMVRTGDRNNIEGTAAQRYWRAMFGPDFRRERDGAYPNGLLNYGYMVLRAAVARAVCGTGLHPSLGIHHRNRYNAFALADDLIEPYRPFVDMAVHRLFINGEPAVSNVAKTRLLGVLAADVMIDGRTTTMIAALQSSAASLRQVLSGEIKGLSLPKFRNINKAGSTCDNGETD